MTRIRLGTSALVFLFACTGKPVGGDTGTEDTGGDTDTDLPDPCSPYAAPCVFLDPTLPETDLLDTVNGLSDGTTVVLGEGTFALDNEVSISGVTGISLIGAGMDKTILDFSSMTVQGNGIFAKGDQFLVEGLTVVDSKKDGIRVEDSDGVTFRSVKVTWSGGPSGDNGSYGLYPVRVKNVLIEKSEVTGASDAGIYVGQCVNAVVRTNVTKQNVAGLEIENTQYAEVYGNTVEDNTGGLVVFDLPGNPIVGHDISIHHNTIENNNRANFAPGGTVRSIPAGTGTFAMASRRVEIANNTYANNNTGDIALISGLVIEPDPSVWAHDPSTLVGTEGKLVYDQVEGVVFNFRTHDVYVHDNLHSGSGTAPDATDPELRPFGVLLAVMYAAAGQTVDNVIYDGVQESSVDPADASKNSNDNHMCVAADEGSFANLNVQGQGEIPSLDNAYRPAAPFTPFDCTDLTGGALDLPDLGQ